jgi:hypothetical protein
MLDALPEECSIHDHEEVEDANTSEFESFSRVEKLPRLSKNIER